MNQLKTKWGEQLNTGKIHSEYPRPTMVRDSFFSLNGEWDYAIGGKEKPSKYDGRILVPFSPESELSGVQKVLQPEEYLHYRKTFTIPEAFIRERVLLHFGAVDQECEVWINGKWIGGHKGGYLPFTFDITDGLKPEDENELTVRVRDLTEKSSHARGKQKLVRTGKMASIFYTPSSGIWKPVWIESVPGRYIKSLKLTPLFDEGKLEIKTVTSDGEGLFGPEEYHGVLERNPYPNMLHIQIFFKGACIYNGKMDKNAEDTTITIPEIHPWTPETPDLYQTRIQYGRDVVLSYFGMRKFHKQKDGNGIWRFYLNNQPFFFHGVLAQGYWPESLMTPPTDQALKYDIMKMKELGFNTLRMHVKVETERFYYHCDKLGMNVWQDMPNGGGEYNTTFVTYLPNGIPMIGKHVKDKHYGWFARKDEAGRLQYQKDLQEMILFLYNHPSIALWTAFNEGWGQFDAKKATELIRSEDPYRLINEACGWFDQKGGDVNSIHNYLRPLQFKTDGKRVTALTEFGGYACPVLGHLYSETEFGYKDCKNEDGLSDAYEQLYERDIYPNISKGLSATIYTQLNDIEDEINGILTYDRKICKFSKSRIRRVNEKVYRVFEESVK